jgi:hypothetical protein
MSTSYEISTHKRLGFPRINGLAPLSIPVVKFPVCKKLTGSGETGRSGKLHQNRNKTLHTAFVEPGRPVTITERLRRPCDSILSHGGAAEAG